MEEKWRDVVGYEGLYQVSNTGRIASGRCELRLQTNNFGYKTVMLYKDGKPRRKTVHRIVADAFIPNTSNYPQINHIDENKANNCVSNLEWCTSSTNNLKYRQNHPRKERKGKNKGRRVLQLSLGGEVIRGWDNARQVFVETGMSDWSISQCCRGVWKTAYGYKWQYAS